MSRTVENSGSRLSRTPVEKGGQRPSPPVLDSMGFVENSTIEVSDTKIKKNSGQRFAIPTIQANSKEGW